jgi:Piwi domain
VKAASNLALNFLAIAQAEFSFTIYRRLLPDSETSEPGMRFLPEDCGDGAEREADRRRYQVAFTEQPGFERTLVGAWLEHSLTEDVLFRALRHRCEADDLRQDVEIPDRKIIRELDFILAHHESGAREVMHLRSHALHSKHRFGFFCGFALRVPDLTQMPEKRRLELSLTQKNGRINEDFYLDHNHKIEKFLKQFHSHISRLTLHDGTSLDLDAKLSAVPAFTLSRRTYVFANKREGKNQFFGLRDNGPFQPAKEGSRLVFLFTKEDRERSQHLFRALRGDLYTTFSGMEKLFRFPVNRDNVSGLEVSGFDEATLDKTCAQLASQYPGEPVVPIALVPFTKHVSPEMTDDYYAAKHAFIRHGLASQFIDRKQTTDRNALKWSISNIGLGIFAKMGGVPWRIKPSTVRCLVVGIGQAHRKVGDTFEKFVAYSVLTDSAGGYETIKMLSEEEREADYIASLKRNLREVLLAHKDQYDSFVLHVTFNMRKQDIKAIHDILTELNSDKNTQREFIAIKFNDKNDYIGFSVDHNSRVPYEGTVASLSRKEYLMWFSGLGLDDDKVPKKPERPVHLRVLFPDRPLEETVLRRVLQDAINIAGANWRGFNAKSMPISVYYAAIIAQYYAHFKPADLPELDFENAAPWFL